MCGVIVSLLFRVSGYQEIIGKENCTEGCKQYAVSCFQAFGYLLRSIGDIDIGLILMNSSLTHLINNLAVAVLLYSCFRL